jgi:hypothetical protein
MQALKPLGLSLRARASTVGKEMKMGAAIEK